MPSHRPARRPPAWWLGAVVAAAFTTGPARAGELTVGAASSLVDAFRELAPRYEALHPDTRVTLTFGASDALVAQVANGAPIDVLATADEDTMNRAERGHLLVPGTRRDIAGNALVVVTPATGTGRLAALADLARPDVHHVALGQPTGVPAGRYARAALDAARLWPAVQPKAVYAQNVRQALDYVARGEVEAGFVYATDARSASSTVRVAFTVPTPTPIRYPAARVAPPAGGLGGPGATASTPATSASPAESQAFLDFLASPAARAILTRHGFTPP